MRTGSASSPRGGRSACSLCWPLRPRCPPERSPAWHCGAPASCAAWRCPAAEQPAQRPAGDARGGWRHRRRRGRRIGSRAGRSRPGGGGFGCSCLPPAMRRFLHWLRVSGTRPSGPAETVAASGLEAPHATACRRVQRSPLALRRRAVPGMALQLRGDTADGGTGSPGAPAALAAPGRSPAGLPGRERASIPGRLRSLDGRWRARRQRPGEVPDSRVRPACPAGPIAPVREPMSPPKPAP